MIRSAFYHLQTGRPISAQGHIQKNEKSHGDIEYCY